MALVHEYLQQWKDFLCAQVSLGALYSRSPVTHKWKAPFRSLMLRECVAWRCQDLLAQAEFLHESGHTLGSRILIRSALETLAILIHLNQLTQRVLDGELDFHVFDRKTRELLLGSRDGSTSQTSLNIVTVLGHCERKYKGISGIYATLSECAHPNYEGVCVGYSDVNFETDETNFSNRWQEHWSERHEPLMTLVCSVFAAEYNDVWQNAFESLERWVEENDAALEASRDDI